MALYKIGETAEKATDKEMVLYKDEGISGGNIYPQKVWNTLLHNRYVCIDELNKHISNETAVKYSNFKWSCKIDIVKGNSFTKDLVGQYFFDYLNKSIYIQHEPFEINSYSYSIKVYLDLEDYMYPLLVNRLSYTAIMAVDGDIYSCSTLVMDTDDNKKYLDINVRTVGYNKNAKFIISKIDLI